MTKESQRIQLWAENNRIKILGVEQAYRNVDFRELSFTSKYDSFYYDIQTIQLINLQADMQTLLSIADDSARNEEDKNIRKHYSAVQKAFEHYQTLLNMAKMEERYKNVDR